MTLTPTFVDPDIFYINLSTTVKYNPNVTNDSAADIEAAVNTAVNNYFAQNITTFGDLFSISKLVAAIDNAKTSILGNSTIPIIQKRFDVTLGQGISQNFRITNKIDRNTISSTKFYYSYLGEILPARIKDEVATESTAYTGTYRRTFDVVTVTTESAHDLVPGEIINVQFSGSSLSGQYTVDKVQSDTIFTLITTASGVDYGTINIVTATRGKLKIFNPVSNNTLNNNIGFVSYDSGVVQINKPIVS